MAFIDQFSNCIIRLLMVFSTIINCLSIALTGATGPLTQATGPPWSGAGVGVPKIQKIDLPKNTKIPRRIQHYGQVFLVRCI